MGALAPRCADSSVRTIRCAPDLPSLGALADAIGGLAAARILSLCFMLTATVLLYLVARRLFGLRAAFMAAALWALERTGAATAFATYDALACLLVALSVWLAMQAGIRRRHGELVALRRRPPWFG